MSPLAPDAGVPHPALPEPPPRPRTLVVGRLALDGGEEPLAAELSPQAAGTGEVLAKLDADAPELVLLDGRLPAAALGAILERVGHTDRPDRPAVIVVTEDGRRTRVEGHLIDHADDFVNGGLGPEVLLARVRTALRMRACLAELARKNAELAEIGGRLERLAGRMAEELRLASHLQRTLLPQPLHHDRLDLAAELIPVREIGGDYYDIIPLEGGRLGLALGDVMGKGVPAALLASTLKAGLRANVQPGSGPAETLTRLNRLFWEITPRGLFATLFFGVFDFARGVLDYVNAGHPPPLAFGAGDATTELDGGGTVLGLAETTLYAERRRPVQRGDVLVLYSDGVSERASPSGELFGAERLREAARRARGDDPRIALYSLLGEIQGFAGGRPADDDQTLIVARVRQG
jgi:serine phosphatase RsbU (regulator of sigma subunit)